MGNWFFDKVKEKIQERLVERNLVPAKSVETSYVDKFCARTSKSPEDIAPHIRSFLEHFDNGGFKDLLNQMNSPEAINVAGVHTQGYYETNVKLAQNTTGDDQAFFVNKANEYADRLNSPLSPRDAENTIFRVLDGVQDAYEKIPYAPSGGIITPLNGTDETPRLKLAAYSPTLDSIVFTPALLREICIDDQLVHKRESVYESNNVVRDDAYYTGFEEQTHAGDNKQSYLLDKYFHNYDLSKKLVHDGTYYTKNAFELNAGLQMLDLQLNRQQHTIHHDPSDTTPPITAERKQQLLQEAASLLYGNLVNTGAITADLDTRFNTMLQSKKSAKSTNLPDL